MRQQKVVNFDDNRSCLVRELKIKQVKQLVAMLKDSTESNVSVVEFITSNFSAVIDLAGDSFQFVGCEVDELSTSEFNQLIDSFLDVHKSILGKLKMISGYVVNLVQQATALRNVSGTASKTT